MRIQIKEKLTPFSHLPGTRCLIPFTSWEVAIYPAKLIFSNLEGGQTKEMALPIEGPVKRFTATQNLEKGFVEVHGLGKKGLFSYRIEKEALIWKKGMKMALPFLKPVELSQNPLRLSLGIYKRQNWEKVKERLDLKEILPFWLRLSALTPKASLPTKICGTYQLALEKWDKQIAVSHFENFFQVAFQGILSPRVEDENHLGLCREEKIPATISPLPLIHKGASQILSLFFVEDEEKVYLLPSLPKEFHAGRLIGCKSNVNALIDLEWSKKKLKKVVIHPKEDGEMNFVLQQGISSYRVRKSVRQKGELVSSKQPLPLRKGQRLHLDRFC